MIERLKRAGPVRSRHVCRAADFIWPVELEFIGVPKVQNPLRHLPSVNELLTAPSVKVLVDRASHNTVVTAARRVLDDVRQQVKTTAHETQVPTASELVDRISDWIHQHDRATLVPVINGTGVLLHTGLGRAPLSNVAVQAVDQIARGYCSLEVDIASGKRSQRNQSVESDLTELTGAEAAGVVNNNSAATLLTLSALAQGKEVIVSRGQLVEIGGNFRLPDVMTACGATLREVGTTNKTRLSDYESAINENTGAIMLVHPSNYRVVGFTESVTIEALAALGQKHQIPVVDDIGSGAIVDFERYKLFDEPHAPTSIKKGADLVLFSGDKLVGGPQAGIICGKKKWVEKLTQHPMMRAMRVDKMTLAALAATLKIYRDEKRAQMEIPLLAMLETSVENLKLRADRIKTQLKPAAFDGFIEAVPTSSTLGGGTLPTQQIDSWGIRIDGQVASADRVAEQLRNGQPSIFGRVSEGAYWIDLRTVSPDEDSHLVTAIEGLAKSTATEGESEASAES